MVFGLFKDWKRDKLFERDIPAEWLELLEDRFDFYGELESPELDTFLKHLRVFMWEKDWFGASDFEVTEEMKLVISAMAARMGRKLPIEVFDKVKEFVIYPGHYKHRDDQHENVATMGTAHHFGTVVLSWDAVEHGIAVPNDGQDTTLHEFAHMLDLTSGEFSGTPMLSDASQYKAWARVFTDHFHRLRDNPRRFDVIDEYGATNEAEFFAVATEVFFEKPKVLRRKAPELFEQLVEYYDIDPTET